MITLNDIKNVHINVQSAALKHHIELDKDLTREISIQIVVASWWSDLWEARVQGLDPLLTCLFNAKGRLIKVYPDQDWRIVVLDTDTKPSKRFCRTFVAYPITEFESKELKRLQRAYIRSQDTITEAPVEDLAHIQMDPYVVDISIKDREVTTFETFLDMSDT